MTQVESLAGDYDLLVRVATRRERVRTTTVVVFGEHRRGDKGPR